MILLFDNYDSFTYNLFHYLETLTNEEIRVVRNDVFDIGSLGNFSRIVLSPGPGLPSDAGVMMELLKHAADLRKPVLGVCLGMQAIGEFYGAELINLEHPFHGVATEVIVKEAGNQLFAGVNETFMAGRYHSWIIDPKGIPDELTVTATDQDGSPMAISHKELPFTGIQFHPESVMTGGTGILILKNWLEATE